MWLKEIQKQAAVTVNRLEEHLIGLKKQPNMSGFWKWEVKRHESCLWCKHWEGKALFSKNILWMETAVRELIFKEENVGPMQESFAEGWDY